MNMEFHCLKRSRYALITEEVTVAQNCSIFCFFLGFDCLSCVNFAWHSS